MYIVVQAANYLQFDCFVFFSLKLPHLSQLPSGSCSLGKECMVD